MLVFRRGLGTQPRGAPPSGATSRTHPVRCGASRERQRISGRRWSSRSCLYRLRRHVVDRSSRLQLSSLDLVSPPSINIIWIPLFADILQKQQISTRSFTPCGCRNMLMARVGTSLPVSRDRLDRFQPSVGSRRLYRWNVPNYSHRRGRWPVRQVDRFRQRIQGNHRGVRGLLS